MSHVHFWVRIFQAEGTVRTEAPDQKQAGEFEDACFQDSNSKRIDSLTQLHGWVFIPTIKANSQLSYVKG